MILRHLLIFITLLFSGCYFRVNLKKKVSDDKSNYSVFIRKDWQNPTYAIINEKAEITNLFDRLKIKANFGLGSTYYCDNTKYPDGLIISKNNFYNSGQCLNGIKYLNIDTLDLKFDYYKQVKGLNKKDLILFIKELNKNNAPFFVTGAMAFSSIDTSSYFGKHRYVFNVTKTNNKYGSSYNKTGNAIKKELTKKTKYRKNEIQYVVTSDTTMHFYFMDNDSNTRLDTNNTFYRTNSFKYEEYDETIYVIHYFKSKR